MPTIHSVASSTTSTSSSSTYSEIPEVLQGVYVIENDDESDANVFVFAAFADKQTGTLYSDLTGTFPFMSLEGNVCFLVVYHYETNAIMAVPLPNFTDEAILTAYRSQF
jgi:hypothetical protein